MGKAEEFMRRNTLHVHDRSAATGQGMKALRGQPEHTISFKKQPNMVEKGNASDIVLIHKKVPRGVNANGQS